MTGFCEAAWQRTETLQRAMLELPFNRELASGALPRDRFAFYLVQDARYLVGFARALAVAAARAATQEDVAFYAGAAREAIVVERQLHDGYFADYGMDGDAQLAVDTSPTCLGYTSYLLATAQTASYAELVAALLPCFWVYQHVGSDILASARPGPDHPYRSWIHTYADDEFARTVEQAKQSVDRAAAGTDAATAELMFTAFRRATEYEWLFWDSAYRLERWPTAALR